MPLPLHPHWQNDPAILKASQNAPPLKKGAAGPAVRLLREALQKIGAPALKEPAGEFLEATQSQVKTFQNLYLLGADGVAGKATINKLDELLFNPSRRKPWPQVLSREEFLQRVAAEGGPVARAAQLPVSAMLACAAVESGWGTGPIFKESNNLFSLQKWPWVVFPRTSRIIWRVTVIQTNPTKTAKAPFTTATDFGDSVRQWCEWIHHYGAPDGPPGSPNEKAPKVANTYATARRLQLLGMTGDPLRFAENLHLVSFGELKHKAVYPQVIREHNLTRFD